MEYLNTQNFINEYITESLNKEIKKIKSLQIQGESDKQILDKHEFSYEALIECNIPISYLIPKEDEQKLELIEWETHTSDKYKQELWDGIPFNPNTYERDRVLFGLLYSAGFKHMIKILPDESREALFNAVDNYRKNKNLL